MRTTKEQLDRMAQTCQREAPQAGYTYVIEYAYGRPVLALQNDKCCGRNVSPRLPKKQLEAWIWAFLEGVRHHEQTLRDRVSMPAFHGLKLGDVVRLRDGTNLTITKLWHGKDGAWLLGKHGDFERSIEVCDID